MRVGVILAVRGPAPYLRESLDSVLAQSTDVVLVDHASRPALVAPDGLRLVRLDDAAGGPAAARQAGLQALDTELVALADADDVWEPGKLAAQVEAFEAHPEAAVCFGRATVIDAQGNPTGDRMPELPEGVNTGAEFARRLYRRNAIPAASAVIGRDALVAVGGFSAGSDLPAGSDWDLWLRLAAA